MIYCVNITCLIVLGFMGLCLLFDLRELRTFCVLLVYRSAFIYFGNTCWLPVLIVFIVLLDLLLTWLLVIVWFVGFLC